MLKFFLFIILSLFQSIAFIPKPKPHAEDSILIIQFEGDMEDSIADNVARVIHSYDRKKNIIILRDIELPDYSYDIPEDEFDGDKLLLYLETFQCKKVIGLTDKRLFHKEYTSLFRPFKRISIFGLGDHGGKACIVACTSIVNLNEICKNTLHEYGHLYGLGHCQQKDSLHCFMNAGDGSVESIDSGYHFCKVCRKELRKAIKG